MLRFTQQPTRSITVRSEQPFAVLTGVALVTLRIYYDEGPSEAIVPIGQALQELGASPSPTFNAIFGHGFGLRDSLAMMMRPGHPSLDGWPAFVDWIAANDDNWWRSLAAASIHTGMDFAGEPIPAEGVSLASAAQVQHYANLVAAPGLGAPATSVAAMLMDPGGALKRDVLETLSSAQPLLPEPQTTVHPEPDVANEPLPELFLRITGRQIPPGESVRLAGLEHLVFLATPYLNNELSISYFADSAVIAFEPRTAPASLSPDTLPEYAGVFSALGNVQRLRILAALVEHVEMYGMQIAEELDIPQATISNHLSTLQTAGLVGSRPTGRRILYALAPSGLALAGKYLADLSTAGVQERSR